MNQQKSPKKNNGFKNAAALSGIAFEMGIIIYLAVKGGNWLDAHYETEKKYFTVIATLLGVAISIWVVLQQLKRLNN
ncbi:AtpZ/AtpI family protein [Muricauda sp. SCSIO 64092]|uniref:AtpZ/AtpI family protein n=1 Tax=Allomuricauda sp. SCSIO 64092 TaxID=2908842 RepID=UPI00131ADBC3|nr:AtpZ/AtpI family protein [Muricauda sp. SCSIO 64092]UOY08800.1 AtpZ/AtpI family protein [Muricauda sp. SCSIO 64092]